VRLLAPTGGAEPYYALYGWAPAGELNFEEVPGADTPWQVESGETLGVGSPVTLVWDNGNGAGLPPHDFGRRHFMFSVTQSVENTSDTEVRLAPYGIVARHGLPDDLQNFFILHEGVVRRSMASSTKSATTTSPSWTSSSGSARRPRSSRSRKTAGSASPTSTG
jgi:YidC/Oxa1 family membrane protein insertase